MCLGVWSLWPVLQLGRWKPVEVKMPHLDKGLIESTFDLKVVPPDLGGMKLRDFQIEQRERSNNLGEYSATWHFQDDARRIVLSLDFPFSQFHPLEVCYQNSGMSVPGMRDSEHLSDVGTQVIREGALSDQFGESSYLYYMEFTNSGRSDRFKDQIREKFAPTQLPSPLFQLQMLIQNSDGITDADHARYRKLLLEAQKYLLPAIQTMR